MDYKLPHFSKLVGRLEKDLMVYTTQTFKSFLEAFSFDLYRDSSSSRDLLVVKQYAIK